MRRKFAIYSGLFTAAMVIFVFGSPFILVALFRITHCAADTCGAVALIYGMFGRTLGVLIYGIAMLVLIAGRCRYLGLSRWWVVASALWLLAARDFLIAGLNFWGVGFSMGIFYLQWPITLFFFFTFIIFLSLWKGPNEGGIDVQGKSWRLAQTSAVLSAVISAVLSIGVFVTLAWIAGFRAINPQSLAMLPYSLYVRVGSHFITHSTVLWILLSVFAGALAYLVRLQRGSRDQKVPPSLPRILSGEQAP